MQTLQAMVVFAIFAFGFIYLWATVGGAIGTVFGWLALFLIAMTVLAPFSALLKRSQSAKD